MTLPMMAQTEAPIAETERVRSLVDSLVRQPDFARLVEHIQAGGASGGEANLDGVWGSSCALAVAALRQLSSRPLVVVCSQPARVDEIIDDLPMFTSLPAQAFPAWETSRGEGVVHDEIFGQRLRVLKQLATRPEAVPIVVTSVHALLQPVPTRGLLTGQTREISTGDSVDLNEIAEWLVRGGFHHTSAVQLPGEFSVRGGILDLFAADWEEPARVELFGDDVDSIRVFDVASQRSMGTVDAIELSALRLSESDDASLADHVPPESWLLLIEPAELDAEAHRYLERNDRPDGLFDVDVLWQTVGRFTSVALEALAEATSSLSYRLPVESVMRFSGEIGRVRDELDAVGADHDVSIVCQTEAEIERLSELLGDTALARDGRLHFPLGRLHEGFRWLPERAVLVGANEMFHRTERPQQRKHLGKVIDSFLDLRSGDFVVHVAHGVGRYRGMKLLEKQDHAEEHLELEFQGGTKLFVPVSKIALVQKYVGGTKTRPTLAKIGGRSWERKKAAVAECVNDMAVELLEVQAARAVRPGIRFSDDSPWQREFEASFPYEETPDQLSAISSIHDDMVTPRPMDRLICGDVGYGKTELAMRSAFKAVDSGYQVGVLVPTTVLAEQHLRTFSERMGEFPVTIDVLSRFRTRRQQTDVLKKLAEGTIDIVVGTHRLAQRDVRFQNLGLLIIDEEQRFGVEIKERLKALRKTVDVLTLTATPIPRTLHMSLVGLRDISNLETPPEDRLAVETRVTRFSPELVRHAILRELNRGGQAFFVHNRIHGIEAVAQQLREVVPEASIEIGHGQMVEGELERVMCRFVEHRFDVLLATTIVESGLDIPNANTIFIDQADRYGLADLHQLRGRVGRYKHRAYCYLLVDPNKHLNPSATKRLRAIEEYSNIGAGFSLAMRDLEIRGAGNILGTEQSGHIAAVGYQFYCELLDQAVRRLKQMPPADSVDVDVDLPGRAFFPDGYVTDMRSKIDLYRRLTRATTIERLDDLRTELNDRFGPPPVEVEWLLEVALLRIHARHHHIRAIRLEDRYAVLDYASAPAIEQLARTASRPVRIADDQSAYVPLPADISAPDALLAELQSLLRP